MRATSSPVSPVHTVCPSRVHTRSSVGTLQISNGYLVLRTGELNAPGPGPWSSRQDPEGKCRDRHCAYGPHRDVPSWRWSMVIVAVGASLIKVEPVPVRVTSCLCRRSQSFAEMTMMARGCRELGSSQAPELGAVFGCLGTETEKRMQPAPSREMSRTDWLPWQGTERN